MQFRAVKGMNDILPGEIERWQQLEHSFIRLAKLYGYSEVRTPQLEPLALFQRSIGETTEVVEKQMFSLERGRETLALRPEGTASIVRAYVNHSLFAKQPVSRLFYLGPMFRAEQPQRGRYRQFHQAGCEIFGDPGPACDAELVDMLVLLFQNLGISNLSVEVNSLGDAQAKERYKDLLKAYLLPRAATLSEHARQRLQDNPLRILDSKDPADIEATAGAPSTLDALSDGDREHFNGLCAALDAMGTPYRVNTKLVRGLDYYTRTLFEISSDKGALGTQNALVGGGRYDGLVRELGGPDVPATGFAIGLERVLLAMPEAPQQRAASCYIAPIGEPALHEALRIGRELRARGIVAEVDGRGGSLKSMLRRANALGARLCLILGDEEVKSGSVKLKDLTEHTQTDAPRTQLIERVTQILAAEQNP